ncbi:MAG: hypothetical protein JWN86_348 [Planctomycetota bacterium]|nr:hypothetical protein [Planctomycetota bacterium]
MPIDPTTVVMVGQVALLVYAVLLGVGGLIGFLKAGSRPSLIAGLSSAAIAMLSLGLTWLGGLGFWLGLILAVLMTGTFAVRFRKTGKFMPSGMLAVMSLVMIGLMGWAISAMRPPSVPPPGKVSALDVDLQATPQGQKAIRITTTDPAKIAPLLALLRSGSPTSDHKCGDTGSLTLHTQDGATARITLLAGHDPGQYEFRVYSDGGYTLYHVGHPAIQQAMTSLGTGDLDKAVPE